MKRWLHCALALATPGLAACPGEPVSTCTEANGCLTDDTPPVTYVQPAFGLGFDCVTIGCVQARDVSVENRGGGVLSLTTVRLTVGSSPDFSVQSASPLPIDLRRGQSTRVTVTYRPLDAEKDLGMLRLLTVAQPMENALAGQIDLPLRVRQNGDPVLGLFRDGASSDAIDLADEDHVLSFGYVEGGTIGRRDLIVRNLTTGNAILELYQVVPGDPFDSAFEIEPLGRDQRYVNPGSEVRVELRLSPGTAPSDRRLYHAVVLVRSNDPAVPEQEVRLFGTAIDIPILEVAPAEIDFGHTRQGVPKQAELTIRNQGGADLVVTPQLLAGGNVGFDVAGARQELPPIAAFGQASVGVSVDATVGGTLTGVVRLESNDPLRSAVDVPLRAFVDAPLLLVQPNPVAFEPLVQGWTAPPETVRLVNTGHGVLHISAVRLETGSSNQFSLANRPELPAELSATDPALTFDVGYSALTLGQARGLIVVESDSVDLARTEVPVSGQGVTCEQGCLLPHATPDCSHGSCEVYRCESGYHDADGLGKTGCECREESPEVGGFCSNGQDLGRIEDGSVSRSGNLHSADDVDLYWFYASDHSDLCFPWTSDGEIDVEFISAPQGVELCVSSIGHQEGGDGCGLGNEVCGLRSWNYDDTVCGGDDDRDVTVKVRVTPGAAPGCAAYTIRFKSSM
ncbi:MAG: choice-of-anchor D domain-containing protein [Deltaproteobacteria bacterium]|nr:choice-of-anchor D domain-containing protein [Deltaproteobacteria bacterium]